MSPTGAAREVLRLAEAGLFVPVISDQVVREMDTVLSKKFPRLAASWQDALRALQPQVVSDPRPARIHLYRKIIEAGDAVLLAGAVVAKVDWLVTWNTRDFLVPKVRRRISFTMGTPGDFLKHFQSRV